MSSHIYDKEMTAFYTSWDTSKLPQPQIKSTPEAEQYHLSSEKGDWGSITWTLENLTTGDTNQYNTCNGTFTVAGVDGSLISEDVTWTTATFGTTSGIWTSGGQWFEGTYNPVAPEYNEEEDEEEEEFGVFTQLRVDIVDIDPAEEWQPREKMR